MYLVKNIVNGKVLIGDLSNLIIGQGQEVDLDTRFPRERIDASTCLLRALDPNRRLLAVLHKDVLVAPPQAPAPASSPSPSVSASEIDQMIRDALSKVSLPQQKTIADEKLDA